MIPKKTILDLIKIANDLDILNLRKEASILDNVLLKIAQKKDYSRFYNLRDSDNQPFNFDLDPAAFNQEYDLPHPYDAESYWDQKLNEDDQYDDDEDYDNNNSKPDYSKFRNLRQEGTWNRFNFDLDPAAFNQEYDLPHPSDAASYWDQRLQQDLAKDYHGWYDENELNYNYDDIEETNARNERSYAKHRKEEEVRSGIKQLAQEINQVYPFKAASEKNLSDIAHAAWLSVLNTAEKEGYMPENWKELAEKTIKLYLSIKKRDFKFY